MKESSNMFEKEMPKFSMIGQYIKDLSFENLVVCDLPQMEGDGTKGAFVHLDIDVGYRPFTKMAQFSQNSYEITLHLKATMSSGERNLFIAEIEYASIIQCEKDCSDEQIELIAYIEVSDYLFFESRNIITSLAAQSGFGPVFLNSVDFTQIYLAKSKHAQSMEARMAQANERSL